ncbi:MAG: prepilin-type N-terminal cleavage/methylation domain-containing protein [Rickettsiales bacterium]|nr:prepilin-type N-terminal cleavage/methylation domain-containing protein [Rickettsiales bacterium]
MKRNMRGGFTLLELSIALVIIALITAMGVMATMGALESARLASTQNKLDEIERSLLAFRLSQNRLPCPSIIDVPTSDENFGRETTSLGSCKSTFSGDLRLYDVDVAGGVDRIAEGAVPVRTLGLSNELAHDGWGRRFSYTVASSYTSLDGFKSIYGRERCGSDVLASSTTTDWRSDDRAAYVLISAGANGHGAFLTGGGIMSAGSVNAAEHLNCRCNATAILTTLTASVQQDFAQSTSNPNDGFDDLVRFKERWQLQSSLDDRMFDKYRDVQLVIGFSGTNALAYNKRCDRYANVATTGAALPTGTLGFLSFANNNRLLIGYSTSSPGFQLFSIDDTFFTSLTAPTCATCDANTLAELTNDGFLSATLPAAPFLSMWKQSGSSFVAQAPITYQPAASEPASRPNRIAISKGAEHVVLSRSTATTYTNLYRRTPSNELVGLTPPASWITGSTIVEFSRDGKYLAAVTGDIVRIWPYVNSTTYGDPVDIDTNYTGGISSIEFSPDSQYIAIGRTAISGQYDSVTNNIRPVQIHRLELLSDNTIVTTESDQPIDIISELALYSTAAAIIDLAFSPDSTYLVAMEANATTQPNKVVVFKKQDNLSFTYGRGVNVLQGSAAPTAMALMR